MPEGVLTDPAFRKKYTIERELGVGGAGVVVCARHRELEERVAIKFLLSGQESPEAVARFRREARAANRVRSQHVVRIIDVSSTEGGIPYVVMEYLEGTDLERMLLESDARQLPVRDAVDFVLQACEALAECHAIGIVHRDLKPSNLFCTYGADGLPCIKVLDFGISKLGSLTVDGAMTGRHSVIGSPRYMPPEQFDNPAAVDRRSDIWALGVILYEFVTGVLPFSGKTLLAIWASVKQDVPQPLSELRRDAPRDLAPVVMRCLEKDPAARYEDVAELAKALLPFGSAHARSTVARIVRIAGSPGVTTDALALPDTGRRSSLSGMAGRAGHAPRGWRTLGLALPVVAAVVGVAMAGHRAQSGSRPSATVAPLPTTTQARPASGAADASGSAAVRFVAGAATDSATGAFVRLPAPPAVSARTAPGSASRLVARPASPGPGQRPTATALTTPAPRATEPALSAAHSAESPSAPPDAGSTGRGPNWVTDIVERRSKPGGTP